MNICHGHVKLMSPDPSNPNQKWVELEDGVILNVGTRMPLGAGGGRTWHFTNPSNPDSEYKFLEMSNRSGGPGKGMAIYCGRQNKDGDRCQAQNIGWYDPAHMFLKVPVNNFIDL